MSSFILKISKGRREKYQNSYTIIQRQAKTEGIWRSKLSPTVSFYTLLFAYVFAHWPMYGLFYYGDLKLNSFSLTKMKLFWSIRHTSLYTEYTPHSQTSFVHWIYTNSHLYLFFFFSSAKHICTFLRKRISHLHLTTCMNMCNSTLVIVMVWHNY